MAGIHGYGSPMISYESYPAAMSSDEEDRILYGRARNLYGKINFLPDDTLRWECACAGLVVNKKDKTKDLRKKLARFYGPYFIQIRIESVDPRPYIIPFDYLVVIDFECTCVQNSKSHKHEIIEFPVVLIDVHQRKIVGEFHRFVRPLKSPVLTSFCTKLTGITQEQVDSAEYFPAVLECFLDWLQDMGLGEDSTHRWTIVTDGTADMGQFFVTALDIHSLPFPHQLRYFVDIKKIHADVVPEDGRISTLTTMLADLRLKFDGRHHSGIDDARNIARLVLEEMKLRAEFLVTHQLIRREYMRFYNHDQWHKYRNPYKKLAKKNKKSRNIPATTAKAVSEPSPTPWYEEVSYCLLKVSKARNRVRGYEQCDSCDE